MILCKESAPGHRTGSFLPEEKAGDLHSTMVQYAKTKWRKKEGMWHDKIYPEAP